MICEARRNDEAIRAKRVVDAVATKKVYISLFCLGIAIRKQAISNKTESESRALDDMVMCISKKALFFFSIFFFCKLLSRLTVCIIYSESKSHYIL